MRESDVEALLLRERRAALPLARQFLLYLDPFALFKDASKGPARVREHALSYNRAMRWVLVPYIRRWLAIAAALFIAVAPTEALAAQAAFFIIPAAALAVACCIAITVSALTVAVYLLLGARWD
ncbi:MAG TPA: hypothetical protein VE258_13605 [Ktedonobacterales bacterium]|jgi:hypothetical protein|nr:hypothetical protein [Ktedonobacterales bacterium]